MMKYGFLIFLFCCAAGAATAASGTTLRFDESVVSASAVGTDTPEKYTRNGEAKEFRFSCPPSNLQAARQYGYSTATFCVFPESNLSKEAQEFSVSAPVKYEFREIKSEDGEEVTYGRTVAAEVQSAKLGGVTIKETALAHLAEKQTDWKQVNDSTCIPGVVLVHAAEPLTGSEKWEFRVIPSPESGLKGNSVRFTPEPELGTGVCQSLLPAAAKSGKADRMIIEISFSSPILKSERENIFRSLIIRSKGQEATTNGDTKTLTINGKEVTFRLLPPNELLNEEYTYTLPDKKPTERIVYKSGNREETLYLEVQIPQAAELDIIIPKGTSAADGLCTVCDHLHRLSFNPAAPMLSNSEAIILPLRGKLDVRLNTLNTESLEICARRLSAEDVLRWGEELIMEDLHVGTSEQLELINDRFQLAVERLRHQNELSADRREELRKMGNILKIQTEALTQARTRLHTILQQFAAFAPQKIGCSDKRGDALLHSREICLNLNTLTDNNTLPGFYIISVKSTPVPAVRELAQSLGIEPKLLETEVFYPILITDLLTTQEGELLIVSRLSDGNRVKGAELLRRDGSRTPLPEGFSAAIPKSEQLQAVCAGDDFFPLLPEEENASKQTSGDSLKTVILHDRPLYRPGETVHLRGIIRRLSATGECRTDTDITQAQLTILRPNKEILLQQDVSTDEFGTWSFSFTLPSEEEDITGLYEVNLALPGLQHSTGKEIPCELFRRNSFRADLKLSVPQIAPERFTAELHAVDLNGMPLSHAEVRVNILSEGPGISLQENGTPQKALTATLRTDDRGHALIQGYITGEFPPESRGIAALRISAEIADDRQNRLQTNQEEEWIYSADFQVDFDGEDRLFLHHIKELTVLSREQKLRVRILGDVSDTQRLSDCISQDLIREQCLYDAELTVPTDCEDGISLPLQELARQVVITRESRRLRILVSGADAAGRAYHAEFTHYCDPEEEEEEWDEDAESVYLDCTVNNGMAEAEIEAPHAGEALMLITSRTGTRVIPLSVRGGEETISCPLLPEENGSVIFQFLQFDRDSSNNFNIRQAGRDYQYIPRPEMQLRVDLNTPKSDLRPGSETELSGKVALPDGAAADAVVTLIAVDAGMLIDTPQSGDYMPDIEELFASIDISDISFESMGLQLYKGDALKFRHPITLLYPRWDGSVIGAGRDIGQGDNEYFLRDDEETEYSPHSWNGELSENEEEEVDEDDEDEEETEEEASEQPRIRRYFSPVAVWQAALKTDAEGNFSTTAKLPDTLTTYRVFAVAVSRCGKRFGQAEGEFRVNQPVMVTPGTPLFMSLGDCLRLPLTITNNTDKDDTWQVSLAGAGAPQSITLKAGTTGTLFFDFTAATEGENTLRWTAVAAAGGDAVEGSFPVRFPAPVLKENHHLVQTAGAEPLQLAALPAAELADSGRSSVQLEMSANPLLHLASAMDFVLSYPYGCTEQTSSGLLPWIFHSRLAPFSPTMRNISPQEVSKIITQAIEKLFQRQLEDGGLGYWSDSRESCLWASAHAALVFTLAEENGISLPEEKMKALRYYLATRNKREMKNCTPFTRYSIGRVCGNQQLIRSALEEILSPKNTLQGRLWAYSALEDIRFIAALRQNPEQRHEAFLNWMRSRGRDYRHASTWQSGWMLVALGEYLRLEPEQAASATVQLQDGTQMTLGNGITRYTPPAAAKLRELPTVITTTQGTTYLNVKFRALPNKTEYPGVTEKGLQVTRVYEIQDAAGNWKPATEFRVGDEVRVTLTCTKAASELEYFVLEDYLPACMEAINPNVPSQAAGLALTRRAWSPWFDHKEYLADRVRGFCTRWGGRDLLNMSYYARVKRAGISTAPPAEAHLMYEPQTYGLSPNTTIISR